MFRYTPIQHKALKLLSAPVGHIMLFGGSRSGKSFVLCCALAARALNAPGSRHAVVRRYCASARTTIGLDTLPKVLKSRFGSRVRWKFNKSENFFRFGNSSEIWLIGLDDGERADKILGKEFATIYFNECSELDYASVQTALTRLAQNSPPLVNRAYYDCNPPGKSHWCYRVFVEKCDPVSRKRFAHPENYAAMQMNPKDNRCNLPADYIENTLANLPLRQQERFLKGEWLDDEEGALWSYSMIDPHRKNSAPELERIIVGIDPAVNYSASSDYTGIVAAGVSADGEFYVLADRSMRATPSEWAQEAVKLCGLLKADQIVVEVNNGGELLGALLSGKDENIPVKPVRAFKDKYSRAEPVAAFYERGLVHHVGYFPELEAQMCSFCPGRYSGSPDRMDALVWAVSELAAFSPECRFVTA